MEGLNGRGKYHDTILRRPAVGGAQTGDGGR